MSYPSTPVDWIPPAPPARGDGRPGRRPAIIDAGRHAGRIQVLSFLAVALAALVAGLAVFIERGDPPVEQPERLTIITLAEGPAAEPGLRVQLALPGVGVAAPASVASLAATGQASPETPGGDSGVALTAARYARHLAAGLRSAADAAVVAPQTADAVQVALAIATAPQVIYRIPGDAEDEVLSETALAVRLGLGSQEALPPFFSYEIERGDTLEKIARRFGIAPESIIFNNFAIGDGSLLAPGGSLTIPTRDGLVYNVRLGDTLYALIENFAADLDATLDFPGNDLSSPSQIVEGSTILLVGGSASVAAGVAGGFSAEPVYAIPSFRWPLGGVLTDFFGSPRGNQLGFHTGVDFSAPTGTFVGAAAHGVVIQAGWEGSFGYLVTVDHGGGVLTRYAHLDHIDVFLGETVAPGDLIGFVGNTGLSSGPHLHFEIIMGGTFVDPLIWLNS